MDAKTIFDGIVAGYKYGALHTVIEYGPNSSNPKLTYMQAAQSLLDDGLDLFHPKSWADLPETYRPIKIIQPSFNKWNNGI